MKTKTFYINKIEYRIGKLDQPRITVLCNHNRLGQRKAKQIAALYKQCEEYEKIYKD